MVNLTQNFYSFSYGDPAHFPSQEFLPKFLDSGELTIWNVTLYKIPHAIFHLFLLAWMPYALLIFSVHEFKLPSGILSSSFEIFLKRDHMYFLYSCISLRLFSSLPSSYALIGRHHPGYLLLLVELFSHHIFWIGFDQLISLIHMGSTYFSFRRGVTQHHLAVTVMLACGSLNLSLIS